MVITGREAVGQGLWAVPMLGLTCFPERVEKTLPRGGVEAKCQGTPRDKDGEKRQDTGCGTFPLRSLL